MVTLGSAASCASSRAMSASARPPARGPCSPPAPAPSPVKSALASLRHGRVAVFLRGCEVLLSRTRSAATSIAPAGRARRVTPRPVSDAVGRTPLRRASSRVSVRMRLVRRDAVGGLEPVPSRAATRWPGGSPCSERNRRTSVTTSRSAANSASAAGSRWSARRWARARPRARASRRRVPDGASHRTARRLGDASAVHRILGDERHERVEQPQQPVEHVAEHARVAFARPRRRQRAASWPARRTSRRTRPRRSGRAPRPPWRTRSPRSSASTSATTACSRDRIQRSGGRQLGRRRQRADASRRSAARTGPRSRACCRSCGCPAPTPRRSARRCRGWRRGRG